MKPVRIRKHLSQFQIITFGFAAVILLGCILLMLPISTVDKGGASFLDSLFTATSAVCVTGLVVHDTATYWSSFGQGVILFLIQIGGMGVVTVAVAMAKISRRKIGLMQRSTMQEAISAPHVGGIVKLTDYIIKTCILIEFIGALFLAPVFCKEFGILKGIWYSIFHSISAFCNAGFDLMGVKEQYSSLVSYASNPIVNITIMALIVIGGLGFLTWKDVKINKFHFKKYRMQTKVVLTVTAILIVLPAIYLFFFEYPDLPLGERILASLFQSVTPRTAGFNTTDLTALSENGKLITIILMITGGSPGSTAGGMKTTTLAVLLASTIAVFHRKEDTQFFGRRISIDTVRYALTILLMYLTLFITGGLIISAVEDLPLLTCLFETASAIGTVGLTLGITPSLCIISKIVLILLMFLGRVGSLTLVFAAVSGYHKNVSKFPEEKITVG